VQTLRATLENPNFSRAECSNFKEL
jgi:hypothetical protein